MKPITSFALLCAFAAVAQGAVTDPVGYITHEIAGGTVSAPGFTYVASTLVAADSFAGASTNNPSGVSVISAAGLPSGLDGTYYVEITEGANEGWWSTIDSVTGSDITVVDQFPTGLAVGTKFAVRKHQTLRGLFGDNEPGLQTGLDLESSDEVQMLDPSSQSVESFFYALEVDGAPADGFYNGAGDPSDSVIIVPGAAVLVKRKFGGDTSFVSSGSVKTTKTQVDLFVGDNWVAPMRATGVAFGDMNLDTGDTSTGVLRGTDLSVDELQTVEADGVTTTAYFAADQVEAPGFVGWYDGGGNDSNAVLLLEGSGVNVRRKFASNAVWTVPAQPIAE